MTTCGFCRREFAPDAAQPTCRACPLSSACGKARCPYCGFENPVEPTWIAKLRNLFGSHGSD